MKGGACFMLAVQVQYFNYLENQRHNIETEQETKRHDIETEQQGRQQLVIQDFSAQTQRLAQEEAVRHNKASETISIASLNETTRHNKAVEEENVRHNIQQEAIGRTQAQASTLSAQASMTSAQASLKSAQLNETKWNTSGYYVEQTERLKNIAQQQYYESQTTTGMMGAVGRLVSAGTGLISTFIK